MKVLIAALALVVAACGGDTPAPPLTGPPPPPGSGTRVVAKLTDFRIELSRRSFTAGTYTFVAKNEGKVTHALMIDRAGGTDNIQPGASAELSVTLPAGKYRLYCPVGTHKALGMAMEINVGEN
jgi:plastocyanin